MRKPTDHFTLAWLLGTLHNRSFGAILLICAVVAIAPGISIIAGVLRMIIAAQMIAGRTAPLFPTSIALRALPTRHLAARLQHALPALRHLERAVHPRWPTPDEPTKRVIGIAVFMLGLANLEGNGLLLAIGLLFAVLLLTIESAAIWGTVIGAKWWIDLW
jgi:hypothetical protein